KHARREHDVEGTGQTVNDTRRGLRRMLDELLVLDLQARPALEPVQHSRQIERRMTEDLRSFGLIETIAHPLERSSIDVDQMAVTVPGYHPAEIDVVAVPRPEHAQPRASVGGGPIERERRHVRAMPRERVLKGQRARIRFDLLLDLGGNRGTDG